jgi:hypothetical protein
MKFVAEITTFPIVRPLHYVEAIRIAYATLGCGYARSINKWFSFNKMILNSRNAAFKTENFKEEPLTSYMEEWLLNNLIPFECKTLTGKVYEPCKRDITGNKIYVAFKDEIPYSVFLGLDIRASRMVYKYTDSAKYGQLLMYILKEE